MGDSLNKLIIGITGMPGSGKSLAVRFAQKCGYNVVVMGNVVREEAEKRGLKPTSQNLGQIMLELRQKEGNAAIAKKCIQKITDINSNKIIIDGARSLDEVEEFKKNFPDFVSIAVLACPETRFYRLRHRSRSDDPEGWQTFRQRDLRELGVGLGNAIAMAEYYIINEETAEATETRINQVLKRVEKKWTT